MSQILDLTGLPDSVVQQVRKLVEEARRKQQGTDANGSNGSGGKCEFISRPHLSQEEFRQRLDELASLGTGKVLPPDFSRADIYD